MAFHFLLPTLTSPVAVEAKIDATRVTLRLFHRSADAELTEDVIPTAEAADMLAVHADPSSITRATPEGMWFDRAALAGTWVGGDRETNVYLKELAQIGFSLDPNVVGSGACSDRAAWMFCSDAYGKLKPAYNRTLASYLSKAGSQQVQHDRQESGLLEIYQAFTTRTLLNGTIYLKYNPLIGLSHNLAAATALEDATPNTALDPVALFGVADPTPQITLIGPSEIAPDGIETITVQLRDAITGDLITDATPELYLEHTAGYLPLSRVTIEDGEAAFRVMATGLADGETIRIKAGWRYYTGLAEKVLTVTNP